MNKAYILILKHINLPMTNIPQEKDGERGNKLSFSKCMLTIRDASYIFQSILVKGHILAYISFFDKKSAP